MEKKGRGQLNVACIVSWDHSNSNRLDRPLSSGGWKSTGHFQILYICSCSLILQNSNILVVVFTFWGEEEIRIGICRLATGHPPAVGGMKTAAWSPPINHSAGGRRGGWSERVLESGGGVLDQWSFPTYQPLPTHAIFKHTLLMALLSRVFAATTWNLISRYNSSTLRLTVFLLTMI